MLRNFSWVIDGCLAGMALPTGAYGSLHKYDPAELKQDVLELKQRGINAVVSLTHRPFDQQVLTRYGLQGIHLPVKDMTAPSTDQIQQFVEFVDQAKENGGVVVHCSAGIGRTGTMLACYLVWSGRSANDAINEVRHRRSGSIETMEQEWAVLDFADIVPDGEGTRKTGDGRTAPKHWMGKARAATSDELERVIDICTAAFSERAGYDRRADFERRMASDPIRAFVENRVLVVDDTIVSALRVYDRSVRIGRSLIRCAGVGDIATIPALQGRGYASHLLRTTVPSLSERGFDLAWLTGVSEFYNQFGWHDCPVQLFEVTRISQPRTETLPCTVRPLEISDNYNAILEIYDRFNENMTYTVNRSSAYWAWLDRHRPIRTQDNLLTLIAHRDGVLVGYLFVERHKSEWRLLEVGCLPPDTGEVATLITVAGRMAVEADVRHFRGVIPSDAASLSRLRQAGIEGRLLRRTPLFGNVMIQVLHLSRLLQNMTSELESRLRQTWQGSIALNTERGDRAVLTIEGQSVCVVESSAADIEITVSSADLAHILLGYRAFSEIKRQSSRPLSKQVRELLDTLFPRTTPIFWGTDYV